MSAIKPAGARDLVQAASLTELAAILSKSLPKRAELQPWYEGGKSPEMIRTDLSVILDRDRSYASHRSALRYHLIDLTDAINAWNGPKKFVFLGWSASIGERSGQLQLNVYGWFDRP